MEEEAGLWTRLVEAERLVSGPGLWRRRLVLDQAYGGGGWCWTRLMEAEAPP